MGLTEAWILLKAMCFFQGQRPALQQRKYNVPPDVDVADSSMGAQEIKYPTIVNSAMNPIEQAPGPSAPSLVSQEWETVDKDEPWDKQVLSLCLSHYEKELNRCV